jgi:PAS domain S-box-containing protein
MQGCRAVTNPMPTAHKTMLTTAHSHFAVCLSLTQAISRTRTVEEIYATALDALADGLAVSRASILLFDPDGVMRFKAYRGLSEQYRAAVEGHTPWTPDTPNPEPIVVADVLNDSSVAAFLPVIRAEGIGAMAFIPLVSRGRVIGKFMLYYSGPHTLRADEIQLAALIALQVAFAVERTTAEEQARRSAERLRFALDAASMGTWDWDLQRQSVQWSDNLARIHGLPADVFDGTFASYEREIHPDDRERVYASIRRAVAEGVPHEVEYRIVAPDGTVRWCEGKGRVEYEGGQPVRMSGVCMMVTRRKEAELARLAAAEEASRLKDEFLATLSHELRTPLNAILGWVQMLLGAGLSPERTRHAVEVIGRNAKLQAQLIEDILDVSRIIAGKLEIERQPVFLSQLVENAVAGVQPAAQARQIDITKLVPPDLPPIEGDTKRLHQVLGNVLSNAIKFTPEGGRVEVLGGVAGDAIEIEVSDSGIGIPPEFLPYVFDRFRQADSRTTRQHGGLGLGLAIARHLLEQHGGEIRAISAGTGRGTSIRMRLPLGAQERDDPSTPAVASDPTLQLRLEGSTVVIVDDQPDSRELLGVLLERCGAAVLQCDSAAGVLDALRQSSAIQLLVADIGMADTDGYELVRQVRRVRPTLPAIAVTGYARREDRSKALAAGFNGYCVKPIDGQELFRTIRDAMHLS